MLSVCAVFNISIGAWSCAEIFEKWVWDLKKILQPEFTEINIDGNPAFNQLRPTLMQLQSGATYKI